jgi:hypothetical protein
MLEQVSFTFSQNTHFIKAYSLVIGDYDAADKGDHVSPVDAFILWSAVGGGCGI